MATAVAERMEQVGLRLHPDEAGSSAARTQTDESRSTPFDFQGFTFRARGVRSRHGTVFTGFGLAVGKTALKKMSL